MKLEKLDHKHALTSWLKVILFACLMLAPIMSVVVRSLYVVCNKNAKDSYSGDTQETITNSYNLNQLEYNQTYDFLPVQINSTTTIFGEYFTYLKSNNTEVDLTGYTSLYISGSNYIIQGENLTNIYENPSNIIKITFTFYRTSNDSVSDLDGCFKQTVPSSNSKLDNVFEYSISQIEESQFYNWTQNTAIYNGVQTMTTGLGITGATVPILITYWFLLTIIYIVIDIVLNLFTYITHYLNKKVE